MKQNKSKGTSDTVTAARDPARSLPNKKHETKELAGLPPYKHSFLDRKELRVQILRVYGYQLTRYEIEQSEIIKKLQN